MSFFGGLLYVSEETAVCIIIPWLRADLDVYKRQSRKRLIDDMKSVTLNDMDGEIAELMYKTCLLYTSRCV